ncbi:UNVERIFIED_CONTAM: hypothetical protein FKN15_076870 [Acipenser sinensis]
MRGAIPTSAAPSLERVEGRLEGSWEAYLSAVEAENLCFACEERGYFVVSCPALQEEEREHHFRVRGATTTCTFLWLEEDCLPLLSSPPWEGCQLLPPPSPGGEVELPLPPYWPGAPLLPSPPESLHLPSSYEDPLLPSPTAGLLLPCPAPPGVACPTPPRSATPATPRAAKPPSPSLGDASTSPPGDALSSFGVVFSWPGAPLPSSPPEGPLVQYITSCIPN